MCEDRPTNVKRGTSARLARIQHARLRGRIARIQPSPPTPPPPPPPPARENVPAQNAPLTGGACPDQPPASPTPGVHMPNFTYQFAQRQNNPNVNQAANDEEWYRYRTAYQTKRDNLMEIAMRTVMLMRQNQQLQQKLAALQAETKIFMQSVANNPPPPQGMPPRNMCMSIQYRGANPPSVQVNLQYPRPLKPEDQRPILPKLNDKLDIPYELLQIVNEARFCEKTPSTPKMDTTEQQNNDDTPQAEEKTGE